MRSVEKYKKLKIEVGASLMMEFHYTAKGEKRALQNITAHFAGLEHGKYILVRLSENIEKYHYVFNSLEFVLVKYILKGTAYVFQTELLDKTNTPVPLIYLAYPENFDSQSLRKTERVKLNPVAKLDTGRKTARGQVIDISPLGARVDLVEKVPNPGAVFPKDLELELSFSLPGLSEPISTKARVMWSRTIESDWCVGLMFIDLPPEAKTGIQRFITSVKGS